MSSPGIYRGNDGGLYYFQSNFAVGGNGRCAWFGFNQNAGWANVFFGSWTRDGQIIRGMEGRWCDVPWSNFLGSGEIAVDFQHLGRRTTWVRRSVTGGFGGSRWSPESNAPSFPALSRGKRDFEESSLSGVWQTNTGAFYYLRELPSGQVFWFAIRPDLAATHVAMGNRRDNRVWATWLDIPPGQVRSQGNLSLRLLTPNFMEIESSSASFGSSRWIKLS